jgi:CubicO group peptidase (beta-lactamase class C family)
MTQPVSAGVPIEGRSAPAFEGVRRLFEQNFRDHGDVGAALAITVDGELVVDLWGGYADGARSRPWEANTIVNTYSTTKGMVAVCAHMLVERGLLDLDAPVAKYWPEFAQAGKESMPVRYLLTHQSGLPALDEPLPPGSSLQWDTMVTALAAQRPLWEPGTAMGYHTITFGWLVGEVIHRVTGLTPGQFLMGNVSEPLGVDYFIGFGPEEDHRVADMLRPRASESAAPAATRVEGTLGERSFSFAPAAPGVGVNHRRYRAAEIPAGNGHGNARALAVVYGTLAGGANAAGVRLLSPASVERARALQVDGHDLVLERRALRTLGFVLPVEDDGDVRSDRAFGHPGMGGSIGYADVGRRLGFGYVMNQMGDPARQAMPDPRWHRIVSAVQEIVPER